MGPGRANWIVGAVDAVIVPGFAAPDQIPNRWDERVVPGRGLHYDAYDGSFAEGRPWSPPDRNFQGSSSA